MGEGLHGGGPGLGAAGCPAALSPPWGGAGQPGATPLCPRPAGGRRCPAPSRSRSCAGGLLPPGAPPPSPDPGPGDPGPAHQFPGPSGGWAGVPAGAGADLSYEGEGGLRWQGAGALGRAQREALGVLQEPWPFPLRPPQPGDLRSPRRPGEPFPLPLGRWDWVPLLLALLEDRAAGGEPTLAAWQLERAIVAGLVEGTCVAAAWTGCDTVALAGGCFQNRSLLEGCLLGLRQRGLHPRWNEQVPCNDGGLALGQAWAVQASPAAL